MWYQANDSIIVSIFCGSCFLDWNHNLLTVLFRSCCLSHSVLYHNIIFWPLTFHGSAGILFSPTVLFGNYCNAVSNSSWNIASSSCIWVLSVTHFTCSWYRSSVYFVPTCAICTAFWHKFSLVLYNVSIWIPVK